MVAIKALLMMAVGCSGPGRTKCDPMFGRYLVTSERSSGQCPKRDDRVVHVGDDHRSRAPSDAFSCQHEVDKIPQGCAIEFRVSCVRPGDGSSLLVEGVTTITKPDGSEATETLEYRFYGADGLRLCESHYEQRWTRW